MTLYIDTQYLTDNTNISQNVDTSALAPNIIKSQDIYISKFLGKELDTYLKDQIGTGLNALDNELVNLIKKAHVEYAAYLSYVDILFKFFNKGALTGNSNNGSFISRNDLIYVRDISKNQADFYLNEVRLFIEENVESYPQYKKICGDDTISRNPFYFY